MRQRTATLHPPPAAGSRRAAPRVQRGREAGGGDGILLRGVASGVVGGPFARRVDAHKLTFDVVNPKPCPPGASLISHHGGTLSNFLGCGSHLPSSFNRASSAGRVAVGDNPVKRSFQFVERIDHLFEVPVRLVWQRFHLDVRRAVGRGRCGRSAQSHLLRRQLSVSNPWSVL